METKITAIDRRYKDTKLFDDPKNIYYNQNKRSIVKHAILDTNPYNNCYNGSTEPDLDIFDENFLKLRIEYLENLFINNMVKLYYDDKDNVIHAKIYSLNKKNGGNITDPYVFDNEIQEYSILKGYNLNGGIEIMVYNLNNSSYICDVTCRKIKLPINF